MKRWLQLHTRRISCMMRVICLILLVNSHLFSASGISGFGLSGWSDGVTETQNSSTFVDRLLSLMTLRRELDHCKLL